MKMNTISEPVRYHKGPNNALKSAFEEHSEGKVWDSFREGSKEALVFIYEKYQEPLYNYACQFTTDTGLVKDCIQDLFVNLFTTGNKLGPTTSIKFYLFRSMRRLVCKKSKRLAVTMSGAVVFSRKEPGFSVSISRETLIIQSETNKWQMLQLNAALENLPAKQREVIYYFYFEGFTYAEITGIMGYSEVKTVRTLMYRALASLRKDIDNNGSSMTVSVLVILLQAGSLV